MFAIHFDGLCQPKNPGGVATYGFVVEKGGSLLKEGWGVVGAGAGMTNNVAEFTALLKALEFVSKLPKARLEIFGDSALVINQVSGKWKVRSETSMKFVPKIQSLLEGRDFELKWVPRDENAHADNLTNRAYSEYSAHKA